MPASIGRDPASDLSLSDPRVSWHHARLTPLPDGRAILEDLDSTNGTFVNGQRVRDRIFLSGGETVAVGDTRLSAIAAASLASPTTFAPAPPPGFPAPGPYPGAAIPIAPPRAGPGATPSVIQRVRLERSVQRANRAAIAALALSVVVIVAAGAYVVSQRPGATVPLASAQLTVADVAAAAEPSTVLVIAQQKGERAGNGSGWVWDASTGEIITNAHVVNAAETLEIGVDSMHTADVLGVAQCEDLAVLHVANSAGLRTLPLGNQSQIRLGDTAIALGYPENASPTDDLQVTVGNVSAVKVSYNASETRDVPSYPNVVQTTAAINPGNSGGPLIGLDGLLIGVNSAKPPGQLESTNYAIGVDRVKEIAPTLASGKSIMWTGLGFDAYVTLDLLQAVPRLGSGLVSDGLPAAVGIYVGHLAGGTSDPGIRLPALIVGANGHALKGSLSDYCSAVANGSTSSVTLSVYEPGATAPRDVTVAYR